MNNLQKLERVKVELRIKKDLLAKRRDWCSDSKNMDSAIFGEMVADIRNIESRILELEGEKKERKQNLHDERVRLGVCPECETELLYNQKCPMCINCGWSSCQN